MSPVEDFVLQALVDRGLLDPALAGRVREETGEGGAAALDRLVDNRVLTREQVDAVMAAEAGMETVDLSRLRVSSRALEAVPLELARRYGVFPLSIEGPELRIAVADPFDTEPIDNLGHLLKRPVAGRLAARGAIEQAIRRHYPGASPGEAGEIVAAGLARAELEASAVELDRSAPVTARAGADPGEAPIIRYVHKVIAEGLKRRASDIHLEPLERRFRIRYRVDGVLHEVEGPPRRLQPAILSRVKLMAEISIAEKRVPQDGRISFALEGKSVDLRVSTLPTAFGESIVLRILDSGGLRLGLPELGFFSDDQAAFERVIALPDGIFLVTGPTGSGKSTTLYSALSALNQPDRKIITVEDPVEYEIAGINQVQVRRDVGMTFAAALRSMLRQAPNIIMVGEIRDRETAEIAVNASLTGHLVFSTLHTNDAPGAVSRLFDIGIKPFLVSASLRAVLAQRLVRRICPGCAAPVIPRERLLEALGVAFAGVKEGNFREGRGCPDCNHTGFRGRIGIFELFAVTEEIERMIYERDTLVRLRAQARQSGMRSMREDGVRKVLAGLTTPEEVLRATTGDFVSEI